MSSQGEPTTRATTRDTIITAPKGIVAPKGMPQKASAQIYDESMVQA